MLAAIKLVNLGTVNKNCVHIDFTHANGSPESFELYFSYETIVAVKGYNISLVSKNKWSKTTGKLLNELEPDKKNRVDHEKVIEAVNNLLKQV